MTGCEKLVVGAGLCSLGECETSFLPDGMLIPVHTGRDQCLVGILAVEQSYVMDCGSWQETWGVH